MCWRDKADLERLFRLLTQRIAFLTQAARRRIRRIRVCRRWIPASGAVDCPDNLTITVSVGHSLFDERWPGG
jgi:deferrochelatase/peroxidase EfeB